MMVRLLGVTGAALAASVATLAILLLASRFAETVVSLVVMHPHRLHPHLIAAVVPFLAAFSGFVPIWVVVRSSRRRKSSDEPLRPRLRNGRI